MVPDRLVLRTLVSRTRINHPWRTTEVEAPSRTACMIELFVLRTLGAAYTLVLTRAIPMSDRESLRCGGTAMNPVVPGDVNETCPVA